MTTTDCRVSWNSICSTFPDFDMYLVQGQYGDSGHPPNSVHLPKNVSWLPPIYLPDPDPLLLRISLTLSADEMWLLVTGSCAWLPASSSAASSSSGLRAHHELHPPLLPTNTAQRPGGIGPWNFLRIIHGWSAETMQRHDFTRKLLRQNSFTPEFCTLANWFCENTAELNSDDWVEICNAT